MIRRWSIRVVALASIGACVVAVLLDAAGDGASGGFYVLYGTLAIAFVGVGWLIAERRPKNVIGPLLLLFGSMFSWYLPADLYLHSAGEKPGADALAVFVSVLDVPMFVVIAMVLLLFPDGTLPSSRWLWTHVVAVLAIVLSVVGYALSGDTLPLYPDLRSPIGIDGFPSTGLVLVSYLCMTALLAAAVAALVVRWRRGALVERTQIKWVVAATVALIVAEVINVVTFRPDQPNAITTVLASVALSFVPIAIGVAILRYRLYEIDRLISRSIGYAVVTGILAVVFGGAIVLLSTILSQLAQGQTIAVAASTLGVFALFQPVRRRVQRVIDQRFDRARYDAEQTAAAFAARLRHETDMVTVTQDLARTANTAVAPTSLSIWLRTRAAGR